MDYILLLWLLVILVFVIFEIMSTTFFSICFSISGIVSLIACLIGLDFTMQIIIYIICLIICLIFILPVMKKILGINIGDKSAPLVRTNLDAIIGEEGICLEDISQFNDGLIKVAGKEWTAKVESDVKIKKDDIVIIENIVGSKVIVKNKEC